MARPSKHDGAVFKRNDGKILWITYRNREGKRIRESTFTEDWQEAQRKLRERLQEIARNVVESQRPSTLIDYATATPFAIGFLETALAIEDSGNGIRRWPITLRNCRSATSNPEPTHRSI